MAPVNTIEGLGIWIAALLTLFIYSFLYKDNPFYKFAEYLFVGVSAGYVASIDFNQALKPKVIQPMYENAREAWHIMNAPDGGFFFGLWHLFTGELPILIPTILGLMMVARLFPRAAWVSRIPLAYIVGIGSGLIILTSMQASVLAQIQASIIDFSKIYTTAVQHGQSGTWAVFSNAVMLLGLCCSLIYFYFSREHTGPIFGTASRIGIWVLMITFGAAFGYTIMARISLLIGRMQFLLHDWLRLT